MNRILFLLFIAFLCFGHKVKAQSVREKLVVALESSKTTDSLYDHLTGLKQKTALTTGYIAALEALKAVHAWSPFSKIKYLNRSEDKFKQAVTADPHNMEIRFMRFSVEHHVPGFLGYNKNLADDRKTIIQQLHKKNYSADEHDLVATVIKFLLDSKRCTPAENEYLNRQLAALK